MKVTHLSIKNYRGIAAKDVDVPPSGVLIKGRNGAGKTSCLRAIRAALTGADTGVDAIRNGADESEILVDFDALSVRRSIRRNGNTSLAVRTADGAAVKTKPQTMLNELLGNAAFDPLDFYLAPKKDRRRQLLEAMPITVTVDRLREWVPTLPESYNVLGHGLEVLERLHREWYERRHDAAAVAKRAQDDAARAREAAEQASAGVDLAGPGIDAARQAERDAQAALARLEARAAEADRAAQRVAATRTQIAQLRDRAAAARQQSAAVVETAQLEQARSALQDATRKVAALKAALLEAESNEAVARASLVSLEARSADARAAADRAVDLDTQASALEVSIVDAAAGVAPGELDAARTAVASAQLAVFGAEAAVSARAAIAAAQAAESTAATSQTAWEQLERIVVALRDEAPRALFAEQNGIEGLAIDGDDILLDGVKLDGLCGAEQMKFAVEVARRANAKAKILVVDGLERLDSAQLEAFVTHATRDDWQLIATRVHDGDVVFEAIF